MAHLVIAVTDATAQQRDSVTTYLGTVGGYWHWMPDFWLVNTNGAVGARQVRDYIHQLNPTLVCIVVEVSLSDSTNWSGLFPTEHAQKWQEWLDAYWKPGV